MQRTNELTTQTNDLITRTNDLTIQTNSLLTKMNELTTQTNNLSTRINELNTQSSNLLTRTNELTAQTNNITNNPGKRKHLQVYVPHFFRSFSVFNSPVPIGYVYVQYPDMPVPWTLWPSVSWLQITSNYAGLFFRAEGGNSNAFDSGIQAASSPRITRMEFTGNSVPNSPNVGLSYNSNEFTSAWYFIVKLK